MSEESAPATHHRPKDKRLSLRVVGSHLEWWRGIARTEKRTLSAMIRDVVNLHVAVAEQTPTSNDRAGPYGRVVADMVAFKHPPRSKRKPRGAAAPCDTTIVLRVPTSEWQRWTAAAERENQYVSDMIRRAVTLHVQSWVDEIERLVKEKEAQSDADD